jgi:signal transduction histidine kinase/DNA-binding response OmpR family regulator/HPt (histidine-containing phosphotransfer) domain-containing protein
LSKPLSDLVKVAHQLTLGDFTPTKSLSIKTNDEIEILANTFIEVSENLKIAYDKIENYHYDLDVQVAERTIALAEMRDQALSANEAKSQFVATVSHEIRNPMHAIINTTELLLNTPLNDKQKNHLNNVINVSNTLVFLINDLLDVAKIEAGKLEIERITLSLSDVLNDIENLTQARAKKKGLNLQFSLDKNIPISLMGDSLRLKQILLNLVTNAIKFTNAGNVFVTIELLTIQPKQVTLKFCVSDTGIGLRSEQINVLFQSFTQADKTIARKHGGTGLGLMICKQLVELMGGKIRVESLWGRGSQFFFTLGIEIEPQAYMNKRTLPERFRQSRVLVVDDDEISRTVLQTYLESFGFLVDNVDSGKQALRLLENPSEDTYHLVLMDWDMPGYDGVETSKKIKLSPKINPTPPIIMVTSRTQEEVLSLIRDEIRAILPKPVDPLDLLENIATVLNFSLPEYSHPVVETAINKDIHLKGAIILVVDDDDINRLIVKEMLENEGLVVIAVNGGEQAIEKVDQQTFDAVLMDLQMPGMDGYETCVKIRRNPKHQNLPIIALSGHAMSEIRDKCFQVGMNDYVSKPFKFKALLKILDRIISSKTADNSMTIAENAAFTRIKAVQPFACLSGVDVDLVLERISGKTELLKKLLFSFADDFHDMVDRIENALVEGDQQEAQRLIHSLKGVSGNLSALPLYESSKQLEHAIIHEPQYFPAALIKCDKALKTLIQSIHKLPR